MPQKSAPELFALVHYLHRLSTEGKRGAKMALESCPKCHFIMLEGVLMTMFDSRTNLSTEVVEEVKKYFKTKMYQTIIPRNVRLSEAPSHGQPVIDYDSKSKGAMVYMELAQEVVGDE